MSAEYYSLDTDYLGFLNAQLRDLKGYRTLANELIQNADDAPGATEISFDVRDDALIVENDGHFSDCGNLSRAECPWRTDPQKNHRCDFHRFRKTASGDKRRQEETSGAFGIGFISVYQITDVPELLSGTHHWRINLKAPADRRIEGLPVKCSFKGTRFILPWAFAPTQLREELGVEPLPLDAPKLFVEELMEHLANTLLFLKKVRKIKLKRNGKTINEVNRTDDEATQEILIDNGLWKVFEGSFEDKSKELKEKSHGRIEEKRRPIVRIALPENGAPLKGIFYASLPTEQEIGLPFHIQADFFPSSDRKRILFDDDYQGQWNRAAVCAAAEILTESLSELPELLGHKRLWQFIEQIREAHRREEPEGLFQVFWENLKLAIKNTPLVFSSREEWLTLNGADNPIFVLRGKEEVKAVTVLKNLEVDLVHPDLIPYSNLLREVGIKSFSARDLTVALKKAGLDKIKPLAESPAWIQDRQNRDLLGEEIEILLERSQEGKEERKASEEALQACAIAITTDKFLVPPRGLRQAGSDIQALFAPLGIEGMFLGGSNHSAIKNLVASFEATDAVKVLRKVDSASLKILWQDDPKHYTGLLKWVVSRAVTLSPSEKLALAGLEIWPSGDSLKGLSSLAIPGDFTDPLGLAEVVDAQVLKACGAKTLIEEFGATPLTIDSYATRFVPKVFSDGQSVPEDARLALLLLLANNLGKLIDNPEAIQALKECSFFSCTDGELRPASTIYFETELVKSLLGNSAFYVALPREHREVMSAFGKELGIRELPRAEDIIKHLESIVSAPPNPKSKSLAIEIFRQLGTNWIQFEVATEEFRELRTLVWLPGEGDDESWYSADEIFSGFRKYLFSTQAVFLDINVGVQRKSTEFMEFLGIKNEPSVQMVVDHVLACTEQKLELSREVYQFLSQHSEDHSICQLNDQECLLIDDDRFLCPSEVFWSKHPFGRYRVTLGDEWRRYLPLLQKVGVRESPEAIDAIDVLLQISDEFGRQNSHLDEESETVLYQCWTMLSRALENEEINQGFSRLGDSKVVPNLQRILNCPRYMFFEDRPRLADKFGKELHLHVIQRHEGAWPAMEAAGVSLLSCAAEIDLLECESPLPDHDLTQRVHDRKIQIGRVFASNKVDFKLDLLDMISFHRAEEIKIRYRLNLMGQTLISASENTYAYFDEEDHSLYYAGEKTPWAALSRELVYAINPGGEAGQIAPGVKEVLSHETLEAAEEALDELGYAPFTATEEIPLTEITAGVGGTNLPKEDEVQDGQPPNLVEGSVSTFEGDSSEGKSEAPDDEGFSENPPASLGEEEREVDGTCPPLGQPDGSTTSAVAGPREPSSPKDRKPKPSSNGGTKSEGKNRPKQPDRLRSYVYPKDAVQEEGKKPSGDNAHLEIDEAGTRHVLRYEKSAGRFPEKMPHTHPGYDVESKDAEGNVLRYIEIKSIGSIWGRQGVGLTDTQFLKAMELKELYWLYVVELAEDNGANIIRIQNPAEKVNDYRFDDGWRACAEPDSVNEKTVRRSILNVRKTG